MAFSLRSTPETSQQDKPNFPVLREFYDPEGPDSENGQVVLFTDYCTGIALNDVAEDVDARDIGAITGDWIDVCDTRWVHTIVTLASQD